MDMDICCQQADVKLMLVLIYMGCFQDMKAMLMHSREITKMQSECVTTDLIKDHKHSPKIKLPQSHLLVAMPKVILLAKS